MMRRIFIDTETTGRSKTSRLVELGYVIYQDKEEEHRYTNLIRPEGFIIPKGAQDVHGISTEKAEEYGIPLEMALTDIVSECRAADLLIAHNMDYDYNIIRNELIRTDFEEKELPIETYCTMKSLTDYCALDNPNHPGYKWPKLWELHREVFGDIPEQEHRALSDIDIMAKCYFELLERGVISDGP